MTARLFLTAPNNTRRRSNCPRFTAPGPRPATTTTHAASCSWLSEVPQRTGQAEAANSCAHTAHAPAVPPSQLYSFSSPDPDSASRRRRRRRRRCNTPRGTGTFLDGDSPRFWGQGRLDVPGNELEAHEHQWAEREGQFVTNRTSLRSSGVAAQRGNVAGHIAGLSVCISLGNLGLPRIYSCAR